MLRISLRFFTSNNRGLRNNNKETKCLPNQWRNYGRRVDPSNVFVLVKLLGINQQDAIGLLKGFKGVRKPTQEEITKSLNICVKCGIDQEVRTTAPGVLLYKPTILEQRIHFFKDLGCRDGLPRLITPFFATVHTSVVALKEKNILLPDVDVTKNLLNCLHEPPPHVPPVEIIPEDRTLGEIHRNILAHYLTWKFELTQEQLDRILANKSTLKYPSFSMLKQMIDILENEFGFEKEKIRRNSYLLSKSPYNTEQILKEIDYIGVMDTKSLILRYPRLLNVQVEKLKEKLKILKDFNVPELSISKCPDIFTLASKTIYNRFVEFQDMTELHGHWAHPRFLMLIFYIKGVKRRMAILKQLNVRCASLHVLCSGDLAFQRYIIVGSDRTKGKDLLRFLCYELGLEFHNDRVELIKRHTMWCQIPFLHIQESFAYLKQKKYTDEDILNNIQLVLYKSTQIDEELKRIESSRSHDSCELTSSRKLALCLYNIEKPYHFDDNGVWTCHFPDSSTQAKQDEEQNSRSLRHTSNS